MCQICSFISVSICEASTKSLHKLAAFGGCIYSIVITCTYHAAYLYFKFPSLLICISDSQKGKKYGFHYNMPAAIPTKQRLVTRQNSTIKECSLLPGN